MNKHLAITVLLICAAAILPAQPFWQIDFKNLSDDVKKGFQSIPYIKKETAP